MTPASFLLYCSFVAGAWACNQVAPANPVNTAVPVVSGTWQVGGTLSSTTGTWTNAAGATYTYQWQHYDNGTATPITGATSSTYVLQSADVGHGIVATVTATNPGASGGLGSASATSAC